MLWQNSPKVKFHRHCLCGFMVGIARCYILLLFYFVVFIFFVQLLLFYSSIPIKKDFGNLQSLFFLFNLVFKCMMQLILHQRKTANCFVDYKQHLQVPFAIYNLHCVVFEVVLYKYNWRTFVSATACKVGKAGKQVGDASWCCALA